MSYPQEANVSHLQGGRLAGQKACVIFSTLALIHEAWTPEQYRAYVRRYSLASHQDEVEKRIGQGLATPAELDSYTWRMEGLYMLLWMLGEIEGEMLDLAATGSLEGIDALEDMEYDPEPWFDTLSIPPIEELLAQEKLLVDALKAPAHRAHPDVVAERLWAVRFMIGLHQGPAA